MGALNLVAVSAQGLCTCDMSLTHSSGCGPLLQCLRRGLVPATLNIHDVSVPAQGLGTCDSMARQLHVAVPVQGLCTCDS